MTTDHEVDKMGINKLTKKGRENNQKRKYMHINVNQGHYILTQNSKQYLQTIGSNAGVYNSVYHH